MHELSLAQSILQIVAQEAQLHGVKEVAAVRISVGKFTHVVPSSLAFSFDLIKENTVAHRARLVIDQVALKTRCRDCGAEFLLDEPEFICPACGGDSVEVVQGQELWIDSIEAAEEGGSPMENNPEGNSDERNRG